MYNLLQRLIALISLIIFSPLFLAVAILIKLESKGPIFFRQERVGKDNINFIIYKFRSMGTDTPDVATHLLDDPDIFITKIGGFLRRTSLDELPQLINIVKGDMLFVGPRPALYNQDDLNELRTEKGVHKLYPGVSGWAQINGRDELEIPDKVEFDRQYLERRSMIFDIQIVLNTLLKVFNKEGVVEGKREESGN
ncbi:MAG: sugar transferase [Romboutsia sp.]